MEEEQGDNGYYVPERPYQHSQQQHQAHQYCVAGIGCCVPTDIYFAYQQHHPTRRLFAALQDAYDETRRCIVWIHTQAIHVAHVPCRNPVIGICLHRTRRRTVCPVLIRTRD